MEKLVLNNAIACIDNGELISYKVAENEFIHQKGSPGWRNADTEMFPIIGPTNEANFKVKTDKGYATQDQHGLLRELKYVLKGQTDSTASYIKSYTADTQVLNSKFPNKSTAENLSWPYDFTFIKEYNLTEKGLIISFVIKGEEGMPFMLGYHPAFNLITENPTIESDKKSISLEEVLAVGSRAYQVLDCKEIVLKDKRNLKIKTEGFGNFMLWTEVPNMICIEPITFYPYAVEASDLYTGFMTLKNDSKVFKVHLIPDN